MAYFKCENMHNVSYLLEVKSVILPTLIVRTPHLGRVDQAAKCHSIINAKLDNVFWRKPEWASIRCKFEN